jgi:D-psicose/D-tagatose/L-ribulose 3-epimerase
VILIKIGITGCLDRLPIVKAIGFDFVEPGAYNVYGMSEEDFSKLEQDIRHHEVPASAFNMFFPTEIKTTGDDVDYDRIADYLHKCLARCKKLGGEVVVYGSGNSRKVPDGFDFEKTWRQLVTFFKLAGDIAVQYNITIVIEPLYKKNTNIINTVAEGLSLCKEVDHPGIRLLADSFHMIHENESPEIILKAGSEYLHHIHIRDDTEGFPLEKDRPYFTTFLSYLKKIGYDKTLSFEVSTRKMTPDEFEEKTAAGLKLLKEWMEEA